MIDGSSKSCKPTEVFFDSQQTRSYNQRLMTEPTDAIVGCDAVNAHVSNPIPSTLWHYTSYAGFQGIVTSKRIWATEYRFLNDRQELLHARELAQTLIEEEPEFIGDLFPARDAIREAVNGAYDSGPLHEDRLSIMVASFSEEGDQLSQWRGYANDSRGVSVGFDLPNLRPPSNAGTAVTFASCVYKQADKTTLVKAIFEHYRRGLQEWWESIMQVARQHKAGRTSNLPSGAELVSGHEKELKQVMARCYAALQYDLLRTAPLLKNESFSEEREWRLVLP